MDIYSKKNKHIFQMVQITLQLIFWKEPAAAFNV